MNIHHVDVKLQSKYELVTSQKNGMLEVFNRRTCMPIECAVCELHQILGLFMTTIALIHTHGVSFYIHLSFHSHSPSPPKKNIFLTLALF